MHAGGQRGTEPFWRGRWPLPGVPQGLFRVLKTSDYNDFRYVCKKQMGLDKVYYVLDPASGALTSLDAVDATGRCAAEGGGARVWEPDGSCFRFSLGGVSCA